MKEVIVKLTSDHIKVKGGEYVQDLVRCQDCKHWSKAPKTERGWCDVCDGLLEPIFFCGDGEVRDE